MALFFEDILDPTGKLRGKQAAPTKTKPNEAKDRIVSAIGKALDQALFNAPSRIHESQDPIIKLSAAGSPAMSLAVGMQGPRAEAVKNLQSMGKDPNPTIVDKELDTKRIKETIKQAGDIWAATPAPVKAGLPSPLTGALTGAESLGQVLPEQVPIKITADDLAGFTGEMARDFGVMKILGAGAKAAFPALQTAGRELAVQAGTGALTVGGPTAVEQSEKVSKGEATIPQAVGATALSTGLGAGFGALTEFGGQVLGKAFKAPASSLMHLPLPESTSSGMRIRMPLRAPAPVTESPGTTLAGSAFGVPPGPRQKAKVRSIQGGKEVFEEVDPGPYEPSPTKTPTKEEHAGVPSGKYKPESANRRYMPAPATMEAELGRATQELGFQAKKLQDNMAKLKQRLARTDLPSGTREKLQARLSGASKRYNQITKDMTTLKEGGSLEARYTHFQTKVIDAVKDKAFFENSTVAYATAIWKELGNKAPHEDALNIAKEFIGPNKVASIDGQLVPVADIVDPQTLKTLLTEEMHKRRQAHFKGLVKSLYTKKTAAKEILDLDDKLDLVHKAIGLTEHESVRLTDLIEYAYGPKFATMTRAEFDAAARRLELLDDKTLKKYVFDQREGLRRHIRQSRIKSQRIKKQAQRQVAAFDERIAQQLDNVAKEFGIETPDELEFALSITPSETKFGPLQMQSFEGALLTPEDMRQTLLRAEFGRGVLAAVKKFDEAILSRIGSVRGMPLETKLRFLEEYLSTGRLAGYPQAKPLQMDRWMKQYAFQNGADVSSGRIYNAATGNYERISVEAFGHQAQKPILDESEVAGFLDGTIVNSMEKATTVKTVTGNSVQVVPDHRYKVTYFDPEYGRRVTQNLWGDELVLGMESGEISLVNAENLTAKAAELIAPTRVTDSLNASVFGTPLPEDVKNLMRSAAKRWLPFTDKTVDKYINKYLGWAGALHGIRMHQFNRYPQLEGVHRALLDATGNIERAKWAIRDSYNHGHDIVNLEAAHPDAAKKLAEAFYGANIMYGSYDQQLIEQQLLSRIEKIKSALPPGGRELVDTVVKQARAANDLRAAQVKEYLTKHYQTLWRMLPHTADFQPASPTMKAVADKINEAIQRTTANPWYAPLNRRGSWKVTGLGQIGTNKDELKRVYVGGFETGEHAQMAVDQQLAIWGRTVANQADNMKALKNVKTEEEAMNILADMRGGRLPEWSDDPADVWKAASSGEEIMSTIAYDLKQKGNVGNMFGTGAVHAPNIVVKHSSEPGVNPRFYRRTGGTYTEFVPKPKEKVEILKAAKEVVGGPAESELDSAKLIGDIYDDLEKTRIDMASEGYRAEQILDMAVSQHIAKLDSTLKARRATVPGFEVSLRRLYEDTVDVVDRFASKHEATKLASNRESILDSIDMLDAKNMVERPEKTLTPHRTANLKKSMEKLLDFVGDELKMKSDDRDPMISAISNLIYRGKFLLSPVFITQQYSQVAMLTLPYAISRFGAGGKYAVASAFRDLGKNIRMSTVHSNDPRKFLEEFMASSTFDKETKNLIGELAKRGRFSSLFFAELGEKGSRVERRLASAPLRADVSLKNTAGQAAAQKTTNFLDIANSFPQGAEMFTNVHAALTYGRALRKQNPDMSFDELVRETERHMTMSVPKGDPIYSSSEFFQSTLGNARGMQNLATVLTKFAVAMAGNYQVIMEQGGRSAMYQAGGTPMTERLLVDRSTKPSKAIIAALVLGPLAHFFTGRNGTRPENVPYGASVAGGPINTALTIADGLSLFVKGPEKRAYDRIFGDWYDHSLDSAVNFARENGLDGVADYIDYGVIGAVTGYNFGQALNPPRQDSIVGMLPIDPGFEGKDVASNMATSLIRGGQQALTDPLGGLSTISGAFGAPNRLVKAGEIAGTSILTMRDASGREINVELDNRVTGSLMYLLGLESNRITKERLYSGRYDRIQKAGEAMTEVITSEFARRVYEQGNSPEAFAREFQRAHAYTEFVNQRIKKDPLLKQLGKYSNYDAQIFMEDLIDSINAKFETKVLDQAAYGSKNTRPTAKQAAIRAAFDDNDTKTLRLKEKAEALGYKFDKKKE